MNINNINNFRNVKMTFWATDVTEMLRQHVAQSGSECHIVGDMSVANFWLGNINYSLIKNRYFGNIDKD